MRSRPCYSPARRSLSLRRCRRRRSASLLCWGAALLAVPGVASADSLSLSVPAQPVQEITGQVGWSSTSEEATYTVLYANNPGIPCGADPQADDGQRLTESHMLEGGNIGQVNGAVNWTPASTGAYTLCGWLEIPAGWLEVDGGAVTATAALPVQVRPPHISLSLSFPRSVVLGRGFGLDLTAFSEVKREFVVVGIPDTRQGCPIDVAATSAHHLIDTEVTGGPWLSRENVNPLYSGRWIFCAWADPPEDRGLYPQATTSLVLNLAGSPPPRRHRRRHRGGRR